MMHLHVQLPFNEKADHRYMEYEWKGEKANFQLLGTG